LVDGPRPSLTGIELNEVRTLHRLLRDVDLAAVRGPFVELVHRLRHAGIGISDRRAVKLQRLLAASALLCGRTATQGSDLWVLRYIWDTEEQQEVLAAIVQDAVDKSQPVDGDGAHPRSRGVDLPDPEQLAGDLERLAERLAGDVTDTDRSYLRDRLGWLDSRCQWVADGQQRAFLERRLEELWPRVGGRL
jgi:MoxR-like ATPase